MMQKILAILSIIFIILVITIPFVFGYNPDSQFFINTDNATFTWDYEFDADRGNATGFTLYMFNQNTNKPIPSIKIDGKVLQWKYKSYPVGSYYHWLQAFDQYGNVSDNSTVIQVNKKTIKLNTPTVLNINNPAFYIKFNR